MNLSNKTEIRAFITVFILLALLFIMSLLIGDYPLTLSDLAEGDALATDVFFNIRLPRSLMAVLAGFALSFSGYVYQILLKNPIASPDVIGVSSGACVGSGFAIVFLGGGTLVIAAMAFFGGLAAVLLTVLIAGFSRESRIATLVLSGIAVNALSQSALMLIKLSADPDRQLAALEYWTMGSLSSMTADRILVVAPIIIVCGVLLYKLHRQMTLLSLNSDTAKMLGVSVGKTRTGIIVISTMAVGAVVSVTGLISFVGLIAPHFSRLLFKNLGRRTMFFSGLAGAVLLLGSDCIVRGMFAGELPISVVTSIIGVPFLLGLVLRGGKVR